MGFPSVIAGGIGLVMMSLQVGVDSGCRIAND
jgi:hypothetical protein